jgi:hypothetical protein
VRVVAAVLLALALPARAQFVAPEGGHYRNGSTLPLEDDGSAGPLLQKLQAAADRLDAEETVALLHALRALPQAALVPLGPRVHVPALERAARLVLEPGREALAAAVLADERAAIAEAARARDVPALLDRATRGYSLPSAREAGLLAGRLLFEEGRFWEAGALAARAGDLPGAQELAAAVARRLPPPPAPPADLGAAGWTPQNGGPLRARQAGESGVPFVASAGKDAVLIIDSQALFLLDRGTRNVRFRPCMLLDELQARLGQLAYEAAARRVVAVQSGQRWVLPYNALQRPSTKFESTPRTAALIAVDVDDAARVAWVAAPPAGDEASASCGTPTVVGGRVFCQVFRTDLQVQASLACFDLSSGRLLWETPLASAPQVPRYATRFSQTNVDRLDKRPFDVAPGEREGVLWCCTGDGVLAAVDGLTGAPRFTFRYDRIASQDPDTYDPSFLYETGAWEDEPVRFAPGRVIVAPPDSRFLYMLAPEPGPRGQLVLDDPIEKLDRVSIVSLRPDPQGRPSPAVLCTRRSGGRGGLVLLGPDGHVLETSPLLPPEAELAGRPLPVGARVLVPTAAGLQDFSQVDLSAPPRPVPVPDGSPQAVVAAFLLDDGLASVAPAVMGPKREPVWIVQWYTPAH